MTPEQKCLVQKRIFEDLEPFPVIYRSELEWLQQVVTADPVRMSIVLLEIKDNILKRITPACGQYWLQFATIVEQVLNKHISQTRISAAIVHAETHPLYSPKCCCSW